MKIAITTVQIPFVRGGAEIHAEELKKELIKAGHEAEIITMPFVDFRQRDLTNHIAAARLMDIRNSWGGEIDLCIGLKFPAYFMPHPNKVFWILHQHRALYDLYGVEGFSDEITTETEYLRSALMRADNAYIPEAKKVFANSKNVSNRLMKYNGIASEPLYHPCPGMSTFYTGEYEKYLLMPSRINRIKRQELALEALKLCKEDVKIYFVGRGDTNESEDAFFEKVERYNLESRIKAFNFVPEEQKLELYANARGVIFIPLDEDYGYITLEAMAAAKPVITATDSGGPLEFVENEQTGFVVEPTAQELADAMDKLWKDKAMAKKMGQNGKKRLLEMDISWENVIKRLTT